MTIGSRLAQCASARATSSAIFSLGKSHENSSSPFFFFRMSSRAPFGSYSSRRHRLGGSNVALMKVTRLGCVISVIRRISSLKCAMFSLSSLVRSLRFTAHGVPKYEPRKTSPNALRGRVVARVKLCSIGSEAI